MARHREKSIEVNFLMNAFLTCSNFIFPLITFPYVSRVLLADGNGKINFATAIVNYFMLFASLGMPLYGVRTCAIVRDDRKKLSRTVKELFTISMVATALSLVVLLVMIGIVPKFQEYRGLVLSSNIWLQTLGMDWLYQALEEYSYITVRSVAFKIVGIILMFMFVHEHGDYMVYAIITVIGGNGSMVLNYLRSFKLVDRVPLRECNLRQHVKPLFGLFLLSAAWSLYANMDTAMLGFLSNDTQNGYFGASVKIKQMLIACISALGTVLLPRLANYFGNGRTKEFYELLRKDSSFIMVAGFYVVVFCIFDADEIIRFLSGDTYEPAVPAMRVIMLAVFFSALYTMLSNNVLVPQGKERIPTLATVIGLASLTALEIVLIPPLGAVGAAIGTTVGEAVGALVLCFYLRHDLSKMFSGENILKCIAASVVASCVLLPVRSLIPDGGLFVRLLLQGSVFTIVYFAALMLMREKFTSSVILSRIPWGKKCMRD